MDQYRGLCLCLKEAAKIALVTVSEFIAQNDDKICNNSQTMLISFRRPE